MNKRNLIWFGIGFLVLFVMIVVIGVSYAEGYRAGIEETKGLFCELHNTQVELINELMDVSNTCTDILGIDNLEKFEHVKKLEICNDD